MPSKTPPAAGSTPSTQNPPPASTTPRWSRKKRFALVYLPIALVLYTLFGFFAVPLIIRKIVIPQVGKRLNGTITLERAYTNPFSFFLELEKLEIKDAAGAKALAFDKFSANFQTLDTIFSRGWHFDEVKVSAPFIKSTIEQDGTISLVKLLKPTPPDPNAKPKEPLKKLPRLVVRDLAVENGEAEVRDLSTPKPFERIVHGANFRITNVDTQPDKVNPMKIEFSTDDGAKVTWSGSLQVNPLTSKGDITAEGIVASRWMPYIMRYTDISLEGATVGAKLSYEFAPAASPRIAKVHISTATVAAPKLVVPWQELLKGRADASADNIVATDIIADADARSISIAKIDITGGESLFELSKGKSVPQRVADALLSEARPETQLPPVEHITHQDVAAIPYPIVRLLTGLERLISDIQNPWSIELTAFDLKGHRHSFADLNAPEAVKVSTSEVSIHAGPIKSAEKFVTPFTLSAKVEQDGTVSVKGTIDPLPRKIVGSIEGSGLNAAAASPYIPASALAPLPPARLGNTILALKGDFRAELPFEGGAKTAWTGRTVLAPLQFESSEKKDVILGAKSLDIQSEATLDTTAAADIDIKWKGTIKGEAFTAAAPLPQTGETKAGIGTLGVDGTLALLRASAGGVKINYTGAASLGNVEASASDAFGPITAGVGAADFKGDLAVNAAPGSDPAINLSGDASASAVKAGTEKFGNAALSVAGAKVNTLKLNTADKSIAAALVSVDALNFKAAPPMIPPEGFTKEPAPTERRKLTLADLIPFKINLDRFEMTGSSIELTDASSTPTTPATVIAAEDITVTAAPFNTSGSAPSEIDIAAKVNNSGKFALTGTLDAFKEAPAANIKVALTTVPVPPYSGPTGRFLGYQMADGRMTTTIPIKIENDKMTGEIDFAFDHLKLGERVKSKDAIDAPLELGLALLRDSNDQIKSRIPVSGELSDPKFSLGGVIWQAFTGLLVKAATAPFQILGAIFGGGTQDLSQVTFAAGSFELSPESISALDSLAKGMEARPGISLSVRGQIEEESDSLELRRQILHEGYAANTFGKPKPGAAAQKLSDQQLKDQTMIAFDQLQVEKAKAANLPPPPSVRRIGSDAAQPPPQEEMEKQLIEATKLPPERIDALAKKRADTVVEFLIKEKKIDASRAKAADPDPAKQKSDKPRAVFEVFK
ncbi:MAG: DUF748 domain-containing protein [Phycisphaerae bacterium]|nr:DUF748 domain-containing protein [Phycisphaerae bacterium]